MMPHQWLLDLFFACFWYTVVFPGNDYWLLHLAAASLELCSCGIDPKATVSKTVYDRFSCFSVSQHTGSDIAVEVFCVAMQYQIKEALTSVSH